MENKEHNLQDRRCECCGYMTYHREHMSCIRAAKQAKQAEPVAITNDQIEELWWGELDNRSLGCIRNIIAASHPSVAVVTSAVPDGYVLVPKEPTQEMLEAAWQYHCSEAYNTTRPDAETDAECYRAMLAAAQK